MCFELAHAVLTWKRKYIGATNTGYGLSPHREKLLKGMPLWADNFVANRQGNTQLCFCETEVKFAFIHSFVRWSGFKFAFATSAQKPNVFVHNAFKLRLHQTALE